MGVAPVRDVVVVAREVVARAHRDPVPGVDLLVAPVRVGRTADDVAVMHGDVVGLDVIGTTRPLDGQTHLTGVAQIAVLDRDMVTVVVGGVDGERSPPPLEIQVVEDEVLTPDYQHCIDAGIRSRGLLNDGPRPRAVGPEGDGGSRRPLGT